MSKLTEFARKYPDLASLIRDIIFAMLGGCSIDERARLLAAHAELDTDGDGIPDTQDADADGDGIADAPAPTRRVVRTRK